MLAASVWGDPGSHRFLIEANSTIKDADVAEVSSDYIKYQILQQSTATLLSTANQMPSIALNLI
jgi:flagellin-like hook-associated protein FlgL